MTTPKILTACLETTLLLLALALLHRWLTFPALAAPLSLWSEAGARAWLVGSLSDVWVATVGGVLVLLSLTLATITGLPQLGRLVQVLLLTLFAVVAALHAAYVDFFHFQILPFHLRYLGDESFLAANTATVLTWPVAVSLLAFPALWLLLFMLDLFGRWSNSRLLLTVVLLLVAALYAHNRNITYREQWFIPDNLQVNGLERLYLHLKTTRLPEPLNAKEQQDLATALHTELLPKAAPESRRMFHLISKPAISAPLAPLLQSYQELLDQELKTGGKPLVMVVLMESMRPAETGYFGPPGEASLTPTLDRLAASGVAFKQAYSTGSVTRGAQEAAFCGYLGSRSTSLMRGESRAPGITCLPELMHLAGERTSGRRGEAFWLHGGDGRFDGQVTFWRSHQVSEIMSLADFPPTTAKTGWGVGDVSFFHAAAQRLITLRQTTKADYLLGLALTVTNHIPWELPSDAPSPPTFAPPAARLKGHPSYLTTAYADYALSLLVESLKNSGVWPHTLLVIASDHGTLLPPLVPLYQNQAANRREEMLASHINLLFSGGLTSQALARQHLSSLAPVYNVSQAGIAPFLAAALRLPEARFMAEEPLRLNPTLPVQSDLELVRFDHDRGRSFSHDELTKATLKGLKPDDRLAWLYARACLEYGQLPP